MLLFKTRRGRYGEWREVLHYGWQRTASKSQSLSLSVHSKTKSGDSLLHNACQPPPPMGESCQPSQVWPGATTERKSTKPPGRHSSQVLLGTTGFVREAGYLRFKKKNSSRPGQGIWPCEGAGVLPHPTAHPGQLIHNGLRRETTNRRETKAQASKQGTRAMKTDPSTAWLCCEGTGGLGRVAPAHGEKDSLPFHWQGLSASHHTQGCSHRHHAELSPAASVRPQDKPPVKAVLRPKAPLVLWIGSGQQSVLVQGKGSSLHRVDPWLKRMGGSIGLKTHSEVLQGGRRPGFRGQS